MNITEDFCSYEVAKLLKEKGFDYQGFDYIDFEGEVIKQDRPTHQMAMKWLREVHHKHCSVSYDIDLYWFFQIIELKELKEHFDYSELIHYHTKNETGFNSYEEAVEAALKYCLENLI